MKPWQAAAAVTGVVVATLVLLLALDSWSGADEVPAPSAAEAAVNVASSSILVFGVFWLVFTVLRVKRDRRDGGRC